MNNEEFWAKILDLFLKAIVPAISLGTIPFIKKAMDKRLARKREKEQRDQNILLSLNKIDEDTRLIKEMVDGEKADKEILQKAIQSMIRNNILSQHRKLMDQGYKTVYDTDNLNKLYESYRQLKGNSTVTEMMEELKTLPVKSE